MVKDQGHGQSISRSEAEFHNNAGNGKTLRAKQNRFGFPIFFEATKKNRAIGKTTSVIRHCFLIEKFVVEGKTGYTLKQIFLAGVCNTVQ